VTFTVQSFRVGETEVPGPEIFWMGGWGTWLPLALQVVLINGPGVTALVNTGPPPDLRQINDLWGRLDPRATLRREPGEEMAGVLDAAGVQPADVTHVLLTPLQLYTTGNLRLFDRARICLSRRGWVHFHTTHDHPHDRRWSTFSREDLVHLVTEGWQRVRLLEDEDQVVPGLRTWWAGAHHRASIVVEADTAEGPVSISDAFFYYENVEENRPLGIGESLEEGLAVYDRVRRTARHIVPLYDPKVFERYPGGVITSRPGDGRP
jgi:hypothetical protein